MTGSMSMDESCICSNVSLSSSSTVLLLYGAVGARQSRKIESDYDVIKWIDPSKFNYSAAVRAIKKE
jgi:hypothetical protein